jgi:signal transduction histidine kinase
MHNTLGIKYTIITLVLFSGLVAIAQNKALKKFESAFDTLDYSTRLAELRKFNVKMLPIKDQALYEHLSGKTHYLYNSGAGAVEHFVKARELYLKAKDLYKAMELAITIAEQKRFTDYKYEDYKPLLDEAIAYAKKNNKPKLLSSAYLEVGSNLLDSLPYQALQVFETGKKIAVKNQFKIDETIYDRRIGITYYKSLNNFKLARHYLNLSLEKCKQERYEEGIAYVYINEAFILRKEGKPAEALDFFNKTFTLKFDNYRTLFNLNAYQFISDTYREMKNYEKALEYLDKKKEYQSKISDEEETKIIRDINTKYETKKKELENQELKLKDEKNKLVIYSFIGIFLTFLAGAYFRISHINKKKKIAEQERLIESQKLENVLKDQELKEIDKILEGQEKERLKIANDLHDNLGSILATLKLNFQNLYSQKSDSENGQELYHKTNDLIEEAYQKVRGMAHTKNAGVIGSEGLVPAVQNIAKKIAIPGKLKVQVIPFGMTKRFENAMEVNLFRMIQEILTNAIKHAEATEITVSLTQDEDSINIIIEDNGKGFNVKNMGKKEGMGLNNITKKVEQLNGTFNIDSFEGKGTTILIDIPL